MGFEARLYIQGTGLYVPNTDTGELRVLFPDQASAEGKQLRDLNGETFCHHAAVVQFDGRDQKGQALTGQPWETVSFAKSRVSVASDTSVEKRLFSSKGRIAKLPHLPEILESARLSNHALLDARFGNSATQSLQAELAGTLHLDRGVLSAAAPYIGKFDFVDPGQKSVRRPGGPAAPKPLLEDFSYTSVLKVEFGNVEQFRLQITGARPKVLDFMPLHGQLEVWVRHFCNTEVRPDPNLLIPEPNAPDEDFALNYALSEDLDGLIDARTENLPYPRVVSSWLRGAPVGGNPRKCGGATTGG